MANLNRTEVKAFIQAASALFTETDFKTLLNANFAESVLFRKDVSSSLVGQTSIDFTDIDYIADNINALPSSSIPLTISGVQQGEIKYLKITKTTAQTISFIGAIDVSIESLFITAQPEVLYRLTNKDGTNIFIEPIIKQLSVGAWQTPSYNANFSAGANPLQYRLAYGRLELRGEVISTSDTTASAFTLPAAYRPTADAIATMALVSATVVPTSLEVRADGTVRAYDWSSTVVNRINSTIILD